MGETKQEQQTVSDDEATAQPAEGARVTREELESLVAARTKELHKANQHLKAQIAEREGIEEALLKQTKIFASILDNMSDAVVVADKNEQFLIFNPAAERMFGTGPTATSAADWSRQYGLYLSDNATLFPTDQLPLARAIRGEDTDDVEIVVRHAAAPNGLWMRVSGRPLKDGAGGSFGGVTVCRDITGTKKEDAFREGQGRILELIAANVPLGEVLTNLMLLIEAQHEEMFCSVLLLADDGAHVRHGAAPSLPEQYVRAVDGAPIGPKNGSCGTAMHLGKQVIVTDIFTDPLWEDYRELAAASGLRACWSTPILSAAGKVLGSFAMYYQQPRVPTGREAKLTEVATHIAGLAIEHQRADEALRRTQGELAHVSRVTTMGELAASIAHEVNQPLGAIVGNADICLQWLKDDRPNLQHLREALEDIASDGRRASDVIARIRSLVKKSEPQSVSLDVNEVVSEVVSLIAHEAQRRQVDLEVELEGLPPVLADRVQLQQVLLNLTMNGIDAMSAVADRKPRLCLTTALSDASVLVSVKDCGVGIKAEDAELVFRAFHTTKSSGMGMGLAISRSIIEAHGGRLWAEPNPDFGATFKFTLPVSEPPA
jgi:signal transduction histidine kinase/PAS domain-containing protein